MQPIAEHFLAFVFFLDKIAHQVFQKKHELIISQKGPGMQLQLYFIS